MTTNTQNKLVGKTKRAFDVADYPCLGATKNETTAQALASLDVYVSNYGTPMEVVHTANRQTGDYKTRFVWQCGFSYTTDGFTCGYWGEGCRGLSKALSKLGMGKITIDVVAGLVAVNEQTRVSFYPRIKKMVYVWGFHRN